MWWDGRQAIGEGAYIETLDVMEKKQDLDFLFLFWNNQISMISPLGRSLISQKYGSQPHIVTIKWAFLCFIGK